MPGYPNAGMVSARRNRLSVSTTATAYGPATACLTATNAKATGCLPHRRRQVSPYVVDANIQPILQQSEIYSGMYGRANVSFFPYNASGKKGIGCGLNGVQKLRDGEPWAAA